MRKLILALGGVLAPVLLATPADTQLRERRVARVVVTPGNVSLAVGGTQQFQVYGLASTGDTVPVMASFRATGGRITRDGLYLAGSVPGSYQVIAILRGDYERRAFGGDDAEDADDVEDADYEGRDDEEDDIGLAGTANVTVTRTGGL